jgi:putative aldouronate transport system permease protein
MSSMTITPKKEFSSFKKNFRRNWRLLVFVLPALLYVIIFAYLPMYGIVIAFQDFTPVDDILGPNANWIGFANFTRFFNEFRFWRLLNNTFLLSYSDSSSVFRYRSLSRCYSML